MSVAVETPPEQLFFNYWKENYFSLDILVNKEVHLILMDIMMPKLDGIKATIKIREEKNIPIILVSAKSEDTDKIMGLNISSNRLNGFVI